MDKKILYWTILAAALLLFIEPRMAQAATTASNTFQSTCATCHGADGGGSEVGKSLHAPDLRSAKVQSHSNAELAHFISDGNGAMPAFNGRLSHQEILNEVHYIRSLARHNRAK